VWYGRGSRYDLVMGHVIVDCRPRGGDTAISYSEMAGYTHLSPQDYALADVYTSRDPNLGNDDGALPTVTLWPICTRLSILTPC